MSSTKIINVLKDDSFQEILNLFKATPAEEVIFVLPKRCKAFQKEDHFLALKAEAKGLGKAVSFLCSNPELNEIAKKHNFDVLLARAPVPRKKTATAVTAAGSIDVVNQIEDFYSEPTTDPDSISINKPEEHVPVAVVSNTRRLDDVLVPESEDQHNVKVFGKSEKERAVEVNQQMNEEHPAREEIESVWSQPMTSAPVVKTAGSSWSPWPGSKNKSSKPARPAHRTALAALACVAVVVLGTVIFISTGKAEVMIKPADQPLDIRINVFASDNIPAINPTTMSIPGQVFNIQKTVSQEFQATGHVDVAQKARGTITAYNEQATTQPLIATTRFESADHHIFHTLATVTIPAAKTVNGKLIPGSIEIQVIADKAGPEYNVPVGLFTVPAFKEKGDTAKYQKVYGQSTSPMHSGANGQSTVMTEGDSSSAKQALTAKLNAGIQEELTTQIAGLKIINSSQVNIGQVSTAGPEAGKSTFTGNLAGVLKTVGFKESDLHELIAQYVDTHNNSTIVPDKLKLEYEDVQWDDTKNGLKFTVHVSGPAFAKVDQQRIVADLLGKNDGEIKAYLGGISGIAEAKVLLSPFWVRSVPKSEDRVSVDISY